MNILSLVGLSPVFNLPAVTMPNATAAVDTVMIDYALPAKSSADSRWLLASAASAAITFQESAAMAANGELLETLGNVAGGIIIVGGLGVIFTVAVLTTIAAVQALTKNVIQSLRGTKPISELGSRTWATRFEILESRLKNAPFIESAHLRWLADQTEGWTKRDLVNLAKEIRVAAPLIKPGTSASQVQYRLAQILAAYNHSPKGDAARFVN